MAKAVALDRRLPPGGHLEDSETTLLEAALRELAEAIRFLDVRQRTFSNTLLLR
ncbi:NUDIX domain-containing protein [Streptosporangium sp. NPDC000563]|uniref:NUDIX domain-containing protein n=1 Tax=unclassified Streptosporangium TaxID=2632669 RepID=UPI00331E2E27